MSRLNAGIIGGSGYVGQELARYLLGHPHLELSVITSRENAGKPIGDVHRGLAGLSTLQFSEFNAAIAKLDLVFIALPHLESTKIISELREFRRELPIVDLGADFRLSAKAFATTYGQFHQCPHLLTEAVYGTPELHRQRVAEGRLIANPGCFAHCIILSLAPLATTGLIDGPVRVSAMTGSSGSGNQPSSRTHHPERNDSVSAYNVLAHRHVPEIEAALSEVAPFRIQLVPLSGPFSRGIFATVFASIRDSTIDVKERYHKFSSGNRFIRLRGDSPRLLDVRGTNFCDIAVYQKGRDVTILSAIDNLGKGAAGNAIQCANLMFGLSESAGLMNPPLVP